MTSVPSSSTLLGLLGGSSSAGTPSTATDGADAFASQLVVSLQLAAGQPLAPATSTSSPSLGAAPATASDPNATPAGPLAALAPAGPQGTHALPATPASSSLAAQSAAQQEPSSGAPVVSADLNESVDTTGRAIVKGSGRHAANAHPDANPSAATSNQLSVPGPVSAASVNPAGASAAPGISTLDTGADAADTAADSELQTLAIESATAASAAVSARPVSARSHLGAAAAGAAGTGTAGTGTAGQAGTGSTPTLTLDAVAAALPASTRADADQARHFGNGQASSNASVATTATAATQAITAPAAPAPIAATSSAAAAPAAPTPVPLQNQLSQPILDLKTAAAGTHVLTIRVAPESIGPVTVRAHISAGSLRVELIAPNSESSSALGAILPDLGRDLAQGGMNAVLSLHQHSAEFGSAASGSGASGSAASGSGQSPAGQSAGGQTLSGQSGNAAGFGGRDSVDSDTTVSSGAQETAPATLAPVRSGDSSLDVLA